MRLLPLLCLAACTGGPPVVTNPDTDVDTEPPNRTAPIVDCSALREGLYAPPDDLPPFSEDVRGELVGCTEDGGRSRVDVSQRLEGLPVEVRSGHLAWLLGYRTARGPGVEGYATARLLVPEAPLPGPQPLVVVVPDLAGWADRCAPSLDSAGTLDAVLLPLAAAGVPVLVPDLAGMGTPSVPGVGHPPDAARSVLDAARAALSMLSPELVSGEVRIVGWRDGASTAVAAHALAADLAPDLELVGVAAVGGGPVLADPTPRWRLANLDLSGAEGTTRVREILALQADRVLTGGDRLDALDGERAEAIARISDAECGAALVAALATPDSDYDPPDTIGQLLDADFRREVIGCVDRTDRCTERAQAVVDRRRAALVDPDVDGELLLIGGELDVRHDLTVQSCLAEAAGLEEACVLPGVDAEGLWVGALPVLLRWTHAGEGEDCPTEVSLPRCPF